MRLKVQPGRALPNRFVEGEDFVLELLRMVDVHHLGPLLCERAAGDGSCDHMRQTQDANSAQRTLRRSEWLGLAVGDLFDLDEWLPGQKLTLRMHRPLLARAAQCEDHIPLRGS